MLLFKKIKIPDFSLIQEELINFTSINTELNLRFWDQPWSAFKTQVPTLYNFLNNNKKIPVRFCRFYLTPPFKNLRPHIDGLTTNKSPIGLNIPIIGYEDTVMNWYQCDDNNLIDGPYGFNKVTASRVVNLNKLVKIASTVVDSPTFVRTDVVHEVINQKSTPRLVLSIRFLYDKKFGQQFEDVLNYD